MDYRGGATVQTFNSPINPLAIVNAANGISGSFAGADLEFMNQAVAVPGQAFPNYALRDTFSNFFGPGGNNFYAVGGPAFKSNYFINQDNARFFASGQHNANSVNMFCFGVGDCIGPSQGTIWAYGGAGDNADENSHLSAWSMQQSQSPPSSTAFPAVPQDRLQ